MNGNDLIETVDVKLSKSSINQDTGKVNGQHKQQQQPQQDPPTLSSIIEPEATTLISTTNEEAADEVIKKQHFSIDDDGDATEPPLPNAAAEDAVFNNGHSFGAVDQEDDQEDETRQLISREKKQETDDDDTPHTKKEKEETKNGPILSTSSEAFINIDIAGEGENLTQQRQQQQQQQLGASSTTDDLDTIQIEETHEVATSSTTALLGLVDGAGPATSTSTVVTVGYTRDEERDIDCATRAKYEHDLGSSDSEVNIPSRMTMSLVFESESSSPSYQSGLKLNRDLLFEKDDDNTNQILTFLFLNRSLSLSPHPFLSFCVLLNHQIELNWTGQLLKEASE